ncbi:phenylacetyl- protein [Mucor ambiguus]|uniref:Phenylacetyl-protein n=1 Tax=Mucor ambiguus TaxID=91626 RepID=A0A0C9MTR1_9FUNG|nr:phenylacetyl- protein [Mucor ambiguus]
MLHSSKTAPSVIPAGDSLYHVLIGNNTNVLPDKPIFVDIEYPYKSLTHGQLKKQILVAAAGLKRVFGVQRMDVVAICSPNHIDYVSIVHGIICAGAIAAPLHYVSMVEDIAYDIKTVQAKYLITHVDIIDKALLAAKEAGIDEANIVVFGDASVQGIRAVNDTLLKGEQEAEPFKFTAMQMQNDPAVLYFTSGTTGGKKAVVRTQNNLLYRMIRSRATASSVVVTYLDFNHSTSLVTVLLMAPYYGYTSYLLNHYSFRGLCAAIERYKPNFITCAPYVVMSLIKDSIAKEYDISSLKTIGCSGALLKQDVILKAHKQLGIVVLNLYGLTEVLGLFTTTPKISLELGGVGVLEIGFTARIVDENGQDVAAGQVGELLIKGPTLTPGYYRNSECNIDQEGFFHTGDLFRCDENGVFFFCDRLKDLMKYYGTQIYPSEIESVLLKHPKVADCAVVGVYQPDVAAEFPRAYVMLADGEPSTQQVIDELQAFSDSQLPEKKRVHAGIIILESLPRTPSGKVQRRLLKESANSIQVGDDLPQDVYNEPDSKLPAIQMNQSLVDSLRLKAARLIDDPDIVILNEQTKQLLCDACCRILSLAENETLRDERLSDYPLTDYITPERLPSLIDLNQFLALNVVPLLLKTELTSAYLQAILEAPITLNSIEVVHHALISNIQVSQDFLHYFISKSIRSCDEKPKRDRKVKLVARFVQSLVERNIIAMKDYFIEIQAFCVGYMKLKGITDLYRLASNEAQKQIVLNQQVGAVPR